MIHHKETAANVGPNMEFVLSDGTLDRLGEVIEPGGWDLKWFKRNPIALFGHASGFPIGTWRDIRVEGKQLLARLSMAAAGTSARLDEIRSLIEQGILKAVSVGFKSIEEEPMDKKTGADPWGPRRYLKQELLECSVVAVPANPAALAVAKSLRISEETMSLVFGEQAGADQGIVRRGTIGVEAKHEPNSHLRSRQMPKTISERVEAAQEAFVIARDAYQEYIEDENFDPEISAGYKATMDGAKAKLDALEIAERSLASRTEEPELRRGLAAPAVRGRPIQADVRGLDLVVRGLVVRGCAHFGKKSVDQVLAERYPGHEATEVIVKTDQTIGLTSTTHWADDIVRTAYADFVDALTGFSVYPALRSRGIALNFGTNGTISVPGRTGGTAGGGFVQEGEPIRVGKLTTTGITITPRKMGVIVAFSRELARHSTPAIESLVRQSILEDTSAVLDPILLDATAVSAIRPAGLLNSVAAAAVGFGGGDFQAVVEDFQNLIAPFVTANAADGITVIMNPTQGLRLAMMPGPDGTFGWFDRIRQRFNILESTHATAGRLIAIRNPDFASANGDNPEFDVSESATVHMEDTTPLEIVSGTGPATADPVRSFFQTATMGVRMLMDISWAMRRTGMVSWINGTTW